jgi:hypothetical protein
MQLDLRISIILLVGVITGLVSCKSFPEIYCNHVQEKDSLSYLNYSGTNLQTQRLCINYFILDSNYIPNGLKKIDEIYLIDLLNHNIIINGYKQYYYTIDLFNYKPDFFARLLHKYNKNTAYPSNEFKRIDYNNYLSDLSLSVNDFYYVGQINLSKHFNSYVVLNQRYHNDKSNLLFTNQETSYFLLNIDQNNKLVSLLSSLILSGPEMDLAY